MGKQQAINQHHQRICKQKLWEAGKTRCEVCGTDQWLSIAHRKTRRHYYADPDKLSDFNEILCLCVPCHQRYEGKTKETEELFKKLRP